MRLVSPGKVHQPQQAQPPTGDFAMATVTKATPKSNKAFYAHLWDQSGVLTQDHAGQIWFLDSDTDELIAIEPVHCTFLTVLGEAGTADCQKALDVLHHGYAAIACTREMGRN
jgi:hypothetical protein